MGLRELKRERTRGLIADKAFDLFAGQGFDHTTVEQIAAAAEVGPSTVYRYFSTKEALVLGFVEDCLTNAAAILRDQPAMCVATGLRLVLERVLNDLESAPARLRAVFDLADQVPSVSAGLNQLGWQFRNALVAELVARTTDTDAHRAELSAALTAGATVNIIETVIRLRLANPTGIPAILLARQALAILRAGGLPLPDCE